MIPPVESFIVVVLFISIFLFGKKLYFLKMKYHRRLLSFSAGVAVAYVFIHLLPELELASDIFVKEVVSRELPFATYHVYLSAMFGFVFFYGLEHMMRRHRVEGGTIDRKEMVFMIHIIGFSGYVWLVSYLIVHGLEEKTTPLILYAIAMSFHFLSIGHALRSEYPDFYDRKGKIWLSIGALFGWLVGVFTVLPLPIVIILLGFISGGVIMNSMVTELPSEKEGRFFPFFLGAILYSVVLLAVA